MAFTILQCTFILPYNDFILNVKFFYLQYSIILFTVIQQQIEEFI